MEHAATMFAAELLAARRPPPPPPPPGRERWQIRWPGGKVERFGDERQARDRFHSLVMGPTKHYGITLVERVDGGWTVRSEVLTREAAAKRRREPRPVGSHDSGCTLPAGHAGPHRPAPGPSEMARRRATLKSIEADRHRRAREAHRAAAPRAATLSTAEREAVLRTSPVSRRLAGPYEGVGASLTLGR